MPYFSAREVRRSLFNHLALGSSAKEREKPSLWARSFRKEWPKVFSGKILHTVFSAKEMRRSLFNHLSLGSAKKKE
jgi:hypothetical protein